MIIQKDTGKYIVVFKKDTKKEVIDNYINEVTSQGNILLLFLFLFYSFPLLPFIPYQNTKVNNK